MTTEAFLTLLQQIQEQKTGTETLEVKAAHEGCPSRLYDTFSAFANSHEGGTIVFGVDETENFKEVGVYDLKDLQKKVSEQSEQMEPRIHPQFTLVQKNNVAFLAVEIPPLEVADKPCFYRGKGRLKGSYSRIGDMDVPMTEYEIYSFEAFRKKYRDELRPCERADQSTLDQKSVHEYLFRLKKDRPNLSNLDDEQVLTLMNLVKDGHPTLAAVLLFSLYPQVYYPQLSIIATVVPGNEKGSLGDQGERFIDNKRIEGTVREMLEKSLTFVQRNMKTRTFIDSKTGKRTDIPEYPILAVREAIINALSHRDYSVHTEGMPIQLILYKNRLEVINPGGLYGRLTVNELGRALPDTRNPVLATALEVLGITENRYSGIPSMRNELEKSGLPQPIFDNSYGKFSVTFLAENKMKSTTSDKKPSSEKALLEFCRKPKTKQEIADFLQMKSISYAVKTYIKPLVAEGKITLSLPDRPSSPYQQFSTTETEKSGGQR
jgi:ATP-dependent DNA helicase RecG